MSVFEKPQGPESIDGSKRREIPKGIATKCPACEQTLINSQLRENLMVCPSCGHHLPLSAMERIANIADPDSFQEKDGTLAPVDILKFTGSTSYPSRIKAYSKATGLQDAIVSGMAELHGRKISIAAMDFNFLGGSMGSVVGEKITRALERGAEEKCPVIIFSASGGARMYEGMFSLMQMAKTSAAVAHLSQKSIPFFSVLTNPTMAGVMASFASLGDLIIAEPKAMIGFAGARVIRETTQQELPKGFQTAEFLQERGLIDLIIHRREMRAQLSRLLQYM